MRKFSSTKESGFTLVETLVAIAIFATSVTALISITAGGINNNVFVKNKLLASYLAQEGVELIRNMRDTAAINGGSSYWATFIAGDIGSCYSSDGLDACMVDGSVSPLSATSCDTNGCNVLTYDEDTNLYGYGGLTNSNFTRTITVMPVGSSGQEILIRSSVSWQQGSNTYTTSYQYTLFDWISNN